MNIAEVRKVRSIKHPNRDQLLNLPPQRVTLKCLFCNWQMKNILREESSRIHAGHLERCRGR